MKPDAALLQEQLVALPFLKSELSGLITELPVYLARAAGLDSGISPTEWWNSNSEVLPNWSNTAKKVMLLQPSSGCVECAISLLNSTFGEQQDSLSDYVQSSIMLQYNKR